MIALDTSAIVAIALKEPEEEAYSHQIVFRHAIVGAPTLLECRLVLASKMPTFAHEFVRRFVQRPSVHPTPFTLELYEIAAEAFARFGKGQGRPGKLNFGDCMSYAVARHHAAPLLYKGDDFAETDIASAAP